MSAELPARRVGVVLGAGGLVGQAYHAGVLSVLEEEYGIRNETIHIMVGTSAGAVISALVRLGISSHDLAAWTADLPMVGDSAPNLQMTSHRLPDLPPLDPVLMLLRRPSMPHHSMIMRAIVRPWQFRPLAAGLALMAPGVEDIEQRLAPMAALEKLPWPERALWICAVRRRDGRRIIFGRAGSPVVALHRAVAASSAVPGYFIPVRIDDHTYVDGGAHSPTNAATLSRSALDLVVVVSPMSGPTEVGPLTARTARRHARRLLERECSALRRAGVSTVVFAPGAAEQDVMGHDMLSNNRLADIVQAAAQGARVAASQPDVNRLLRSAVDGTGASQNVAG